MKLLLILSLLLSLTSIAVPLRAEQGICEMKFFNYFREKKIAKIEAEGRFLEVGSGYWLPSNCEQGDAMYLLQHDHQSLSKTAKAVGLLFKNCEIGTIESANHTFGERDDDHIAMRCIFRGFGNELKNREAAP